MVFTRKNELIFNFLQDGKTALHLAAEAGKSEVIRKLLNLGVEVSDRDAVNIRQQNGPLVLAIFKLY